jgi:lysozyme
MNIELLRSELKRDEGMVLHAYECPAGYTTIGVGRMIDKRRGGGISEFEAEFLLQNDIDRIVTELYTRLPWFERMSDARQRALINMAFQLGVNGLLGFNKMLAHMSSDFFNQAANEALNSRWAEQTPERAERISKMIREG